MNFKQVKSKTKNFTIVSNDIIKDTNLSLKAKGLLITLLSLPPQWHFTEKGLSVATGEGLKSIRSGLQELEDNKYLFRYQTKSEDGKFGKMNYIVFEEPTDYSETSNDLIDENVKIVTKTDSENAICQKGITEENNDHVVPKGDNGKRDNAKSTQLSNNILSINQLSTLDDDDDKTEQELTEIIDMYETYSSKKLTKANLMSLSKLLDQVEKDLLLYAIQKLEDVEKPMSYLKSIIKDYVSKNITNVTEALAYDRQFKKQKKKTTKANKINSMIPSPSGTPVTQGYYDWMAELN